MTGRIAEAIDIITQAMQEDQAYAWSWHCNLWAAAYDSGVDRDVANEAAARFMETLFGINTRLFPQFQVVSTVQEIAVVDDPPDKYDRRRAEVAEPDPDPRTGFMCLTDFEDELYAASGGIRVHPSVDDLLRHSPCGLHCGIVQVRVEQVKVLLPWGGTE
jgi:hypothetical protein